MRKPRKLGFGCLGNGITVWDSNRIVNGDYPIVAHISESGKVNFRKVWLSEADRKTILDFAKQKHGESPAIKEL